MPRDPRSSALSGSTEVWQRLEPILERFETAWQRGEQPDLDDYLTEAAPGERRVLLVELIHEDLDYRIRAGAAVPVEAYLRRYPELNGDAAVLSELLATEETLRRRCAAEATLPAGPGIPGYELLGVISCGGMGVVYKARQVKLNRVVAVKMILGGGHAGAHSLARFKAEAEAIARLQHPNIVQIHEVGEAEGKPFFSLEFCAGGSLADRLKATALAPREAAALVGTLARAMNAAHDKGIIHRDLKPANVLLTADGTLKIADFGLVKNVEDGGGQTESGAIVGTPSYMAPEQTQADSNAGGREPVGPATDVYALGALLYECLTGRPPFKASTPLDTILQVRGEEPVPPARLQRHTPHDLQTICLKCLHKNPRRRYPSAQALADDLARFLAGEPIQARSVSRVERLWKWGRRRPATAALLALSVLAGLTALGLGVMFTARLRQERDQAEQARTLAEKETRRAETLLVDMYSASGLVATERGQLDQAALWFATAAELAALDPHRARTNRLRFHLWSRALPAPSWAGVQPARANDPPWLGMFPNTVAQFLPHPDGVHFLARSADSRRWTLWNTAADKPVALPYENEDVTGAGWNPTGDRLALGTRQGRCLILRWPEKKVEQESKLAGPVGEVSFSKDGRWLAVAQGKTAGILDVARRSFLSEAITLSHEILWLVFDGRGTRLAVASTHHDVHLYRLQAGGGEENRPSLILKAGPLFNSWTQYHLSSHLPPVWVNDDRGLLTCARDGEISWWDPDTGKEVRRLKPNLWNVASMTVSPNAQLLAVTGWFGCQVYDLRSGQAVGSPRGHSNHVPCAAFSADSRWLLTGSTDQTIKLWPVAGSQPTTTVQLSQEVTATAFLGSRLLAGQKDGVIRVWQRPQAILPRRDFPTPKVDGQVADLTTLVDETGQFLLAPADGAGVQVIDLESGRSVGKLPETAGPLLQGTFLPRHSHAVLQNADTVAAWNWRTGQLVWGPVKLPARGYSVAASPDGRRLVSMCADRGLLLDAATGRVIKEFVHEGAPELANHFPSARFSPDGTCFVSHYAWRTVTVWDADTARPRFPPLAHGDYLAGVAFSQDSRYLATGATDSAARVFDLKTGQELAKIPHPHWVFDVAFSPDRRRLLTANRDGAARLWDWAEGKLVCPPMAQGTEMTNACFLSEAPWLFTMAGESLVVWDARLGKPVTPPLRKHPGGRGLRLVLGGRHVAAFSNDGQVRVFDLASLEDDNPRRWSAEQLRILAEMQSMHTVHEGGGLVRLTTPEWLGRYRELAEMAH